MVNNQTDMDYFLQVVKEDEDPVWPREEDELLVGRQNLGTGYVQYWAYPKFSGRNEVEVPEAEDLAQTNYTPKPAILVNQLKGPGNNGKELELILVKDGHAWGRTLSSLPNLEDNINSILELAEKKFGLSIEHFMTTPTVSPEVEEVLDNLENNEHGKDNEDDNNHDQDQNQGEAVGYTKRNVSPSEIEGGVDIPHIRKANDQYGQTNSAGSLPSRSSQTPYHLSENPQSSKLTIKLVGALIIVVIVVLFGSLMVFKDKLPDKVISKVPFLGSQMIAVKITPTPIIEPSPTPTPTPSIERGKFNLRILNGTSVSGAAGELGEVLEEKGWKVAKVGNYLNFKNEQTFIKAKKGMEEIARALVEDLSSSYEATISGELKDSEVVDAEVIIGKK